MTTNETESVHEPNYQPAPGGEAAGSEFDDLLRRPIQMVETLARTEMDLQADVAAKRERSITKFRRVCEEMIGTSEEAAGSCIYRLPRDGKKLEGPTVRLADIVVYAWGNCRVSARVIEISRDMIVARGTFHDIERNTTVSADVPRRITNKYGRRYNDDMIVVTGAAACAIARRNAVFAGVPRPAWEPVFVKAMQIAAGKSDTLVQRRQAALDHLKTKGVAEEDVLRVLNLKTVSEIGLDELLTLRGILEAVKDGDTTIADAFGLAEKTQPSARKGVAGLKETLAGNGTTDGGQAAKAAATERKDAPATDSALREAIARAFGRLDVDADQVPRRLSNLLQRDVSDLFSLDHDALMAVSTLLGAGRTGADGELESQS